MKKALFLMHLQQPGKAEYSPAIFNWYGILEKIGYEVFYHEYHNFNMDELYNVVKDNRPDYVFHPTYTNLHTEFTKLREFTKLYVIHSDDDWRFDNFAKFWTPFTDGAIGYQNSAAAYAQLGAAPNYYMRARWAFNPNTMFFKFDDQRPHDVTHVGKLHGTKDASLQSIVRRGVSVKTIDPNFDSYEAYLKCYAESKVSLSFTSNVLGTAAQSKTRTAEMPFYCVLASEAWPQMELWNMEPGKDFILLDPAGNYVELINRVIKDPSFRKKMHESGKSVLLSKNTVFHEWNRFMQNIDPDFTPVDVEQLLKTHYAELFV